MNEGAGPAPRRERAQRDQRLAAQRQGQPLNTRGAPQEDRGWLGVGWLGLVTWQAADLNRHLSARLKHRVHLATRGGAPGDGRGEGPGEARPSLADAEPEGLERRVCERGGRRGEVDRPQPPAAREGLPQALLTQPRRQPQPVNLPQGQGAPRLPLAVAHRVEAKDADRVVRERLGGEPVEPKVRLVLEPDGLHAPGAARRGHRRPGGPQPGVGGEQHGVPILGADHPELLHERRQAEQGAELDVEPPGLGAEADKTGAPAVRARRLVLVVGVGQALKEGVDAAL